MKSSDLVDNSGRKESAPKGQGSGVPFFDCLILKMGSMDKVKRFFELKELWKKASEVERIDIDRELSTLMDSMNDTERENLIAGVSDDFKRLRHEVADIRRTLSIRKQLEPILPYISVSSLAKDYFGKSSSWFYQRLNGNIIHGKVASFTDKEILILNSALKEIGAKIKDMTVKYNN
ncbi:DUF5053 domain-containing protein [Bacteroides thetaiotaomicron]|jgi:hypothetical protein|uniref:DUF5053 domain-containing protein n=1 Tax=Bacteroides thetaiotaomicron TaxID=818 RepID=UPI002030FD4D|nr:DUF5053 domain-containing protein [Bacteroides thetaiotaomicron]DAO21540.1 MAG TPA: protein of unknown function (DUF5053) [Caudoviricetes sp.]MCM1780116.1 DUF5053 domain-containing protein [Bacteroides thetaiotaomicron]MCS2484537.1 DUF5053 domain-containing protein [Bacteroides thetaiotaomicron]MCS2770190.1 DUF5053 domain-containing protein [Bacteroides thetaiotaomicron]MCS3077235.1 DUF5053 domain-containing protein [Bacteroides thetaiotaomicron]